MLRLRFFCLFAAAAAALCAAQPAISQSAGLSTQLDAAEKKLDDDIKNCRPIDPKQYQQLAIDANRNAKTAIDAHHAGAPIDLTAVNADLKRATLLFDRARVAAEKPCPPPQQKPQKAGPPKKTEPPQPPPPVQAGGIGGGVQLDPWTAMKVEAWDLFDELEDAMWNCDLDTVKKLIPELEDLLKRVQQTAQAAKAAGKFSKIKPEDAQRLANSIEDALDDAEAFKGCALFKQVPGSKTAPPKKEEPKKSGQPSKSSLNDLFKPEEKPTPPKISIVEDLVEPPTPAELRMLQNLVSDLRKTTAAYPQLLEGCQPGIWDKHIAHLEAIAKRARQIAEWAKAPGQTTGVDPRDAERLADEAQQAVDEAKRGKAANEAQWHGGTCPMTPQPLQPKEEPRPKTGSQSMAVPRNPEVHGPGYVPVPTLQRGISGNGAFASPVHPSAIASRLLEVHNAERLAVHVRPLRWNLQLQQDATAYAETLARTGQLVHAPREGRGIERENLGQGRIDWSPEEIVSREWVSEKRYFQAGYFPNVCAGGWSTCAHYTQMIWPTTTDIGCGYALGGGYGWLVCRYSPGGNKDNQPVGYRDPSTYLGGPLDFNPSYSPVLKAVRPVNPDKLEFGDEAVAEWKNFENSRGRCSVTGMSAAIDKLKYYAQAAHEHSAEEHSKGKDLLSGSYDAMAKQIDERVQDASLYRDACARNPYYPPERG